MEEPDAGLSALISLRKQRPSYARMISWEIGRSKRDQDVKTKTRKSSKSKNRVEVPATNQGENSIKSETTDDEESDESEYFSAEEDVFILMTESESEQSTSSNDEKEAEQVDNDVFANYDPVKIMSSAQYMQQECSGQSRKGLSKKQKKKKRQIFKINNAAPFSTQDLFEVDFQPDLQDFRETDVYVLRPIPSLVELCLRVRHCSLESKRLSVNINAAIRKQHFPDDRYCLQGAMNMRWSQKLLSLLSALDMSLNFKNRNLWNMHPDQSGRDEIDFSHKMSSFANSIPFLFDSHLYLKADEQHFDMGPIGILNVLAHAIDIMVPAAVHSRKGTSANDAMKLAVFRVRKLLHSRFPSLVEHFFNAALPYMYWTRGDVDLALESFIKNSEQDTEVRNKSMYLNEAARMLMHFDLTDLATKFYQRAVEVTFSDPKASSPHHEQYITIQGQILVAQVYNCGLLNAMKSRQSAAVWSSILKHDALPHNVARAAVESFLCCHSGSHNDSTRDWLEEAVQRVKAGRVHEPGLGLHLSLAYALLGDSVHSLDAYREYLRTSRSDQPAVGQQLVNRKCRNPWQHLMQLMNLSKQPLTAMKILWRFQATYPFLNDIGPSLEGELSNETLNLTMTPEGFLTGDMQMQLPPVQSVFLDPYTGQRSINNGRRPTHVWTEGRLAKKCERLADYFWMPTDFNVYHDDNGNRVTLKLANSKIVDNKMLKSHSTQMMQLYWRGADGQTAHLDLYSIIQRRSREINAINFKSGYGAKYSYINKQYPELVSEAFDMCEKQRWHFKAVEHYLRHVDSRLSKKKKGNDVLKLNDNNERKVMREQMSGLPFVVRISNFIQFKDHLCIHFIAGQGSSEIYCMFFDCTNAETFREPVVRHMTEHNNMLAPAEFDLADHSRHPEWGMVGCCQLYTVLTWMFRNGKGEYLGEVATKASSVIKLIKEKTVFWNKTSVTLCRRQFDHQEEPQEDLEVKTETPILAMDCLGSCEVILLHTEDGVAFLDPETLERIKISLLDGQKLKLEISDEGKFINGSFTHVKVVGRKTFHSEVEVRRVYVAIDNTLLTMDVTTPVNSSKTSITVTVSMELVLSGYPTEVCYISREAGFLVSTSMDANREKKMSREHILHFDYDGLLCGILPFLGPGPRSFYPVYLPGNLELIAKSSDHGKSGWHVFFRDGHGGICCLRAGLH